MMSEVAYSSLGLVVSGQSGGSRIIRLDRTPGRIADDSRQPWTCMQYEGLTNLLHLSRQLTTGLQLQKIMCLHCGLGSENYLDSLQECHN